MMKDIESSGNDVFRLFIETAALAIVTSAFLLVAAASAAEGAPSFACKGTLNSTERAICGNSELAQLDTRLAGEYRFRHQDLRRQERRHLRLDQRDWRRERNSCGGNFDCIRTTYQWRIEELVEWDL